MPCLSHPEGSGETQAWLSCARLTPLRTFRCLAESPENFARRYDTSMSSEVIRPVIGRDVYIAPSAYVGGDVTLGDECTVMHQVVIRGDVSPITIGRQPRR